jgi:hypothetical protein
MSRATIIIFLIGILLLVYGYLCRFLSIYFFWDSKHFGWILIFTGIMSFLIDQKHARIVRRQNVFFVRVMLVLIILLFAAVGSAIISLKASPAWTRTAELIKLNGEIRNDIGDVKGLSLFLAGPEIMKTLYSTSGTSSFIVTVRGEKKRRDVEVRLIKESPWVWGVSSIRIIYT